MLVFLSKLYLKFKSWLCVFFFVFMCLVDVLEYCRFELLIDVEGLVIVLGLVFMGLLNWVVVGKLRYFLGGFLIYF